MLHKELMNTLTNTPREIPEWFNQRIMDIDGKFWRPEQIQEMIRRVRTDEYIQMNANNVFTYDPLTVRVQHHIWTIPSVLERHEKESEEQPSVVSTTPMMVVQPTMDGSKVCKSCSQTLSLESFPKNGNSYRSECKACRSNNRG